MALPANALTLTALWPSGKPPCKVALFGASAVWVSAGMFSITMTRVAVNRTGCASISNYGNIPGKRVFWTWPDGFCSTNMPPTSVPTAVMACGGFPRRTTGPIGFRGDGGECNYCCSFHGPLGLHFLKSYLAVGSDLGVFVNFPLDFASTLKSGGRDWRVTASTRLAAQPDEKDFDVELAPADGAKSARTTLWVRRPDWADGVKLTSSSGSDLPFSEERGYLRLDASSGAANGFISLSKPGFGWRNGASSQSTFRPGAFHACEKWRFWMARTCCLPLRHWATNGSTLLAQLDSSGRPGLWPSPQGGYLTVQLPDFDAGLEQVTAALSYAKVVTLRPESELPAGRRARSPTTWLLCPPSP